MSLNHLTNSDPSADKLDVYLKTVNAEEVKCDSVTAGTITGLATVTSTFFRTFEDRSWSDVSDVALTSSFPLGFISGISAVTYDSFLKEKYDPDTFSYVKILQIKVRADCAAALPPAANPCGFIITVYNLPVEFLNATLRFGRADFRSTGGSTGATGLGFFQADTSVAGQISFSLANSVHTGVLVGSNIMDAELEVRALPPP
jgi:hypothetical protein